MLVFRMTEEGRSIGVHARSSQIDRGQFFYNLKTDEDIFDRRKSAFLVCV